MGRPPLPIGTYGNIKTTKVGKIWEARAYYRGADGRRSRLKRVGPTAEKARNNLKQALTLAVAEVQGDTIGRTTRFRVVAEKWFQEFGISVAAGTRSPASAEKYRDQLDLHVLPALGERQMLEIDTGAIHGLRRAKLQAGMALNTWRVVQGVISSVCGYAVVHKALGANPVRDLPRLEDGDDRDVRALSANERTELLEKLEADRVAVEADLPDVVRGLLATGFRISELLACSGDDFVKVDDRYFLRADYRMVKVKGQSVLRQRRRANSKGAGQMKAVPGWAVPMFTKRKLAAGPNGPLYPHPTTGAWREPGYVGSRIVKLSERAGLEAVRSHVMRKTHATALSDAGLSTREVGDELGQKTESVTRKHYIAKRGKVNLRALDAIEGMFGDEDAM